MTYRITGLDPAPFAHLIGASDEVLAAHDAVRMTADTRPGFPCRITLDDAEPGDTLILTNHVSLDGATPYRATHAIFVGEHATEAAVYEDQTPPVFATRVLSLRGFDANGIMRDAALAQPGEADVAIRAMLGDAAIAEIHVHNATRGCFSAKVTRT